ncbi:MAG TPA: NAD(P)H-binding protein [Rhizomicrobium sp.]|nr:NAD(P)H-binding protein [Rhizomicrobium sp.]
MNLFRRTLAILALLTVGIVPASAAGTRIVVYGATGAIGGLITQEALQRGDSVIGVARDPSKLKIDNPNYKAVAGDVTNLESFKSITAGADAVIISVLDAASNSAPENSVSALAAKTAVAAYSGAAKSPHIIQIGAAPTMMYDTRAGIEANVHMPPGNPMMGIILGHAVALETYRASHINWTVLTPPSDLQGWTMGKPPMPNRTGKYRTSTTELVKDAQGKSAINVADLAVAAVDEAEHPRFIGQRFTVGY